MAVVKCTKCDWKVQQDETWDEKAEEHFLETNHGVFATYNHENLPKEDW